MLWCRISALYVSLSFFPSSTRSQLALPSKSLCRLCILTTSQGAATAVEDGGVLAACIDHAHSLSSIPDALKAYEKLRRPRSERVQAAALTTGQYKVMPDGPAQQDRDLRMAQRMDKSNPRYKFWKAAGGVEWFYGYKFEKEVSGT